MRVKMLASSCFIPRVLIALCFFPAMRCICQATDAEKDGLQPARAALCRLIPSLQSRSGFRLFTAVASTMPSVFPEQPG